MKKALAMLVLGSAMVASANAQQEVAGGAGAGSVTVGGVAIPTVVGGTLAGTMALAAATNSDGTMNGNENYVEPTVYTCDDGEDDYMVGGYCYGSYVTSTVTGTGTNTYTVPLTVTYVYSPTAN